MFNFVESYKTSSDWFAFPGAYAPEGVEPTMVYGDHGRKPTVDSSGYSSRPMAGNNKFFVTFSIEGETPEWTARSALMYYRGYIRKNPRFTHPVIRVDRVYKASLSPSEAEILFEDPAPQGAYVVVEVSIVEASPYTNSPRLWAGEIVIP